MSEATNKRLELLRTLDEILDEHEECLKENWENLPRDTQIARIERVAETRRGILRILAVGHE